MTEPARVLEEKGREELATEIAEVVLAPGFSLPTLPSSAAEVMRLANLSEVDFRRVDKVVRRDPMLAARVLSIANSPAFSARGGVMSLRTAMMLLGWKTLRDVLWQVVAEAHLFRRGRRQRLKGQRQHAVAVAHLTRRLSLELSIDSEHAFVCGLLHDIGEVLTDQVLSGPIGEPLSPEQREALSLELHTKIGPRVATAWSIPALAATVMEHHHDYDSVGPRVVVEHEAQMPIVVAAAERVASTLGVGDPALAFDAADPVALQIFGALELDEAAVLSFIERCDDLRSHIL